MPRIAHVAHSEHGSPIARQKVTQSVANRRTNQWVIEQGLNPPYGLLWFPMVSYNILWFPMVSHG
jgi:hypothetical protein